MTNVDNVSQTLASFAAGLQFGDLPGGVVEHAKLAILDGLGCCLHGAMLPWTRTVAEMVSSEGGTPDATLIADGRKVPVAGAVLVNATAGHAFELDDIHRDAILHPNSITVPVALALAERMGGGSGARILTAVVAGYEVGNRVGAAAGADLLLRGFHPQGTVGAIAAATTAARMMDLDSGQTLNAIGIAGSLGAGLMASQEGAMVKRLHSGRAAESGVRAADLAARGFTGISDVVEAEYGGFLSSFAGTTNLDRATRGLGDIWETEDTGFKLHATVTSIHTALDALSSIMSENNLKADQIRRVTVGISRPTYVHCAWSYTGQSVTAAQMNLYCGLAMIALHGEAFVDQFQDAVIRAPELFEFIERIEAEIDPEIDALGRAFRHMARLRVETTDGQAFQQEENHRRGSPQNPVDREVIERKFDTLAGAVVGHEKAEALKQWIAGLEAQTDTNDLMATLGQRR
ncbi:MAG: MmgE/PrpD family protein [Rhodospirillaceae bacterium]|nr:MmgE/PrpD family protein [Rhodospirillaceae bacterium]